jgi:hypothetical protein
MKNKLLPLITFLFPFVVFAQFDGAPWEKPSVSESERSKKTFNEYQSEFYSYWKDKDSTVKGCGYKVFKRWEDYWSTRLLSDGTLPSSSIYWEEYEKMKADFKTPGRADIAQWKSIGPFSHTKSGSWSPGQGRVNVVIEDPVNNQVLYLGAPNGGLWKSTDEGVTWTSLTDNLPRIGVSAIAIDPKNTNVIYLGMGDDDASDCPSIGIMKSTDGGNTWNLTGLTFTATGGSNTKVNEVYIDPTNSNTLWTSTSTGLYKSTDAGANWNKTLTGNIKDMKLKPNDPTIIYAVTANTFHKSTDGGQTFTTISSGLPTGAARFSIDVTAANPEVIYLLAAKSGNGYQGVYKSTNSGTSFSAVNTGTNVFENTQSWYTMPIGVSSTNENEVYTGCLNIWKSTNGGSSFTRLNNWNSPTQATYTHADIHFIRSFKGGLFVGSDGGIYRSKDKGASFKDLTKGVAVGQFYRISGSPTNKNVLVGGLQDNGGFGFNGTNWNNYHGADGMDCAMDATNSSVMYGFIQNGGSIYRSTTSGQSGSQYASAPSGQSGNWITPLVGDVDGSLIAGYSNLYRLKSGSWSQISTYSFGGNVNGIELAPSNTKVMYVFKGANLYKTTNGGSAFTNITSGLSGTITSVEAHYNDPNKVWVTVGGWTSGTKIFYSSDGGTTWTNITKNLPNFPANIIKQESGNTKDALYIGLDVGIYYTDNTMSSWEPFMNGLPNSSVRDLELNENAKIIRAGTYGRGIWESPLYSSINTGTKDPDNLKAEIGVFPNPSKGLFNVQLDNSQKNKLITIEVFNIIGEQIYAVEKTYSDPGLAINIADVPSGVYYVTVKAGDKQWNKKIVKE